MSKIAFLFPGQGSQYKGMGKELFEDYSEAQEIYEIASEELKWDVADLCFNDPDNRLNETVFTQPAILTTSTVIFKILEDRGIYPSIVAGHSLGEYSAILAGKGVDIAEAVKIVQKRGEYMQEAVSEGRGMMAAIIGLSRGEVEDICQEISSNDERAFAANYNSPLQIVITGMKSAVEKAMLLAKEKGARKVVALPVTVPSHSPLMESAGQRLAREFEKVIFRDLTIPLVNNIEAREISKGEEIKTSLIKQLSSPVLWEDSIRYMVSRGYNTFVEVGPGRVLSGLTKKIYREAQVFNIDDRMSLQRGIEGLRKV